MTTTPPLVSAISPTFGRRDLHPMLYRAFARQDHPRKQLVVLDDTPGEPSPFFDGLRDDRVRYVHAPARRLSIGAKRNRLCELADGEVVAHLDDDDYYAPGYLAASVARLEAQGAELTKLSAWLLWRPIDRTLWHWDTRRPDPSGCYQVLGGGDPPPDPRWVADFAAEFGGREATRRFVDGSLWGYGFSYVYRRALWAGTPFPDRDHGEDLAWVEALRSRGAALHHAPDEAGLALHLLHARSSSCCYPDARLPSWCAEKIFGEPVRPWLEAGRADPALADPR